MYTVVSIQESVIDVYRFYSVVSSGRYINMFMWWFQNENQNLVKFDWFLLDLFYLYANYWSKWEGVGQLITNVER